MPITMAVAFPVIFLLMLLFIPNGVWKMGERLKRNGKISDMATKAQKVEIEQISKVLTSSLKEKDGTYQIQKIQNSINYVIARHDWYEEQRSVILTNILTVSGLAFAGMAAYTAIENVSKSSDALLIIGSIGCTILIGIYFTIHLYNSELDQDRPYRLIADIRHWYFLYSMPDRVKHYGDRLDYDTIAQDVLDQKRRFFDRVIEVANLDLSIREDLEQLFILHVLVKHKSESLQKMRWVFSLLIIVIATSSAWFFLYYGFLK